jgi:hypothetical protein
MVDLFIPAEWQGKPTFPSHFIMKRYPVIVSATVLFALLFAATASALPLGKNPNEIRAAILMLTPLGTPFYIASMSIKKLHPETYYTFQHCPELPKRGVVGKAGVYIAEKWPLVTNPTGKAIICRLGEINESLPFTDTAVDAWWTFDANDKLVDIYVGKHLEGL